MDDMMSKISALLDDPTAADKIKQIASSLSESSLPEPPAVTGAEKPNPSAEKQDAVPVSAFGGNQTFGALPAVSNDKIKRNIALLNAITPYMRPSRSEKIASAIKAIQIIDILSKAR